MRNSSAGTRRTENASSISVRADVVEAEGVGVSASGSSAGAAGSGVRRELRVPRGKNSCRKRFRW